MQVKYLLKTAYYRIRGLHLVFEPGGVYDIDPATVAAFGLLTKTDGFGWKAFEAVKQVHTVESSEPVPTPDEVFLANKKVRDEALAKEQADRVKSRKDKAAKEAADRKEKSRPLREAVKPAPEDEPVVKGKSEPKEKAPPPQPKGKGKHDAPSGTPKGGSKLSARLRATPH
jgi:hypothetical protein